MLLIFTGPYGNLYLQIYDIIGYIYQYIKLLRDASPQEWIFKELQDIGNMDFRYAEEQAADDYAAELSGLYLYCHSSSSFKALIEVILACKA